MLLDGYASATAGAGREETMALTALGAKGNVKPGRGDEFIELFDTFDYSDVNPVHKSPAQVKDGVLCRDVDDPDHFYLLGEWSDITVHAEIRKRLADVIKPEFVHLVEDGRFVPTYAPDRVEYPAGRARSRLALRWSNPERAHHVRERAAWPRESGDDAAVLRAVDPGAGQALGQRAGPATAAGVGATPWKHGAADCLSESVGAGGGT